ncbi:MAG: pyrimidine 5'-nucleotidase [Parvularculaceae bacterium]
MTDLSYVDAWVFDLDNTLYPAECNLFRQIDARMAAFIERRLGVETGAARRLQKDFYVKYGTTLAGLMREHGVKPREFLDYVHDIDLSVVAENRVLASRIAELPGRKFIFTNGSTTHAERVIGRLGFERAFDAIFDIHAADYLPKPHRDTYEKFLARHEIAAPSATMFEDIAHNLEAAHALGMTTVLVASEAPWIADEPADKRPAHPADRFDHVHHVTDDLTAFLRAARTSALSGATT